MCVCVDTCQRDVRLRLCGAMMGARPQNSLAQANCPSCAFFFFNHDSKVHVRDKGGAYLFKIYAQENSCAGLCGAQQDGT